MPRTTLLVNTHAGTRKPASVDRIVETLREAQLDVDVRRTDGGSIAAIARAAIDGGADIIVAAGGDGTVGAAASAVVGTRAALGVVPLGTLNHFSKDLDIPFDVDDAARTIGAGRTITIDVGDVNGRVFVNNASVGMYASLVSERGRLQRTGRRKWVAHAVAALRVWWRNWRLRIEVDGTRVVTPFVFVGNNEYQLSGLELGGRKTLTAGQLHVCLARGMSRSGVARMILTAFFGDLNTLDGFESFTTPAVALDAGVSRLQLSIDGEVVTLDHPLTFRVRRQALRVIVP